MALTDLFRTGMDVLNQPFVSNVALPGIVSLYNQKQQRDAIGDATRQGVQGYQQAGQQLQTGADRAIGTLEDFYGQGRDTLAPYADFGEQGLAGYGSLMQDPSQVVSDPGYQFRVDEGTRAMERSGAAKGMLLSGNTLRGLQDIGQQQAMDEYDRALQRRALQIETGLRGAGTLADLGQAYASGIGGIYEGLGSGLANLSGMIGETRAGGTIGQAGARTGTLSDIVSMWQGYKNLKGVAGGSGGGIPGSGVGDTLSNLYTSTIGALPYTGAATGLSAIGPGSQAGMLALQDAGLQGAQALTLDALSSGASSAGAGAGGTASAGGLGGLGSAALYGGIALGGIAALNALSNTGTGGWDVKLQKVGKGGPQKAASRVNAILSGKHSWSQEGDTPYVIAALVKRGVLSEDDPRVQQYISNVIKKPSMVSFRPDAAYNQGKDHSWTKVPADEYGQWMWNKAKQLVEEVGI